MNAAPGLTPRRRYVVVADEPHPDTGTLAVFGPFDDVEHANDYLDSLHDTWGGGSVHLFLDASVGRGPR